MASMRDIKQRKTSITSTQQITKAMKLVSTVKLQRARVAAEQTVPYFSYMYQTVSSMLAHSQNLQHPYLSAGDSPRKAMVVITSNRGLAGGYNANIVKMVMNCGIDRELMVVYAVGSKGAEMLAHRGYHVVYRATDIMESPNYSGAVTLCNELLSAFAAGEVGEIYMVYTHFKNTVVHIPVMMKLLPISIADTASNVMVASDDGSPELQSVDTTETEGAHPEEPAEGPQAVMTYEPTEEEAIDMIIPKYMTSLFYGALMEASASENGARMQAMDNATSNAEDMIADLTLQYNRARQGSITQELTEIIAGANATA